MVWCGQCSSLLPTSKAENFSRTRDGVEKYLSKGIWRLDKVVFLRNLILVETFGFKPPHGNREEVVNERQYSSR